MGNCFSRQPKDAENNDIVNQPRPKQLSTSTAFSCQKTIMGDDNIPQKSNIIIPLYIYPYPDAWQDLHQSIQDHPDIQFTVIINPYNGPGPDAVPDEYYLAEVPRLTVYSNVDVLGYVHVTYTKRDLAAVVRDVETYSAWIDHHEDHPGLKVDGIFIDEAPFDVYPPAEEYLRKIQNLVKSSSGFGKKRTIVHNPGCVPAFPISFSLADVTIVFEDSFDTFKTRLAEGQFDLHQIYQATSEDFRTGTSTANATQELDPNTIVGSGDHESGSGAGNGAPETSTVSATVSPDAVPVDGEVTPNAVAIDTGDSTRLVLDRSRLGLMIHSIPANAPEKEVQEVMTSARALAGSIFVTESDVRFYERFSNRWKHWVEIAGGVR